MKTLYIECNMGAAGDMLMSALLELHPDGEGFIKRLNGLGIPRVHIERNTVKSCGLAGTHVSVAVDGVKEEEALHSHRSHEHRHSGMEDIKQLICSLKASERVKSDALRVYGLIAEAESRAHNTRVENIHFHEVGTMDAVADIVGVCMLIEELNPDEIIASPINTGSGSVKCAHGILPVPAPATAYILRGVPIYSNNIEGELCTPTGAALLKHFACDFAPMPLMKTEKIGYGMGTRSFEAANCVRAFLGERKAEPIKAAELMCNVDDMTGENVGFAISRLFEAGAWEAFTVPIGMKKGRPGILLVCICAEDKREEMLRVIFKHTTTIGVRENILNRYTLDRHEECINTPYGSLRIKVSRGYGVTRRKAEYEDLAKIAVENNIAIDDIEY